MRKVCCGVAHCLLRSSSSPMPEVQDEWFSSGPIFVSTPQARKMYRDCPEGNTWDDLGLPILEQQLHLIASIAGNRLIIQLLMTGNQSAASPPDVPGIRLLPKSARLFSVDTFRTHVVEGLRPFHGGWGLQVSSIPFCKGLLRLPLHDLRTLCMHRLRHHPSVACKDEAPHVWPDDHAYRRRCLFRKSARSISPSQTLECGHNQGTFNPPVLFKSAA